MQRRSAITLTSGKSQANLILLIQSFAFFVFVQVYNIMYKRSGDLFAVAPRHAWLILRVSTGFFVYLLRVSATSYALFIPLSLLVATTRELYVLLLFLLSFLFPKVTVDRDEVLPPTACKLCVQPRPLAVNVALPAFAAERRAAAPCLWRFHAGPGEARGAQASQIVVRPQSLTGPQI